MFLKPSVTFSGEEKQAVDTPVNGKVGRDGDLDVGGVKFHAGLDIFDVRLVEYLILSQLV